MTEDEAKTKWCPHVREADEDVGTWNRLYEYITTHALWRMKATELDVRCCCIGSGCMMWKWVPIGGETGDGSAETSLTFGYCGLAGKP